MRGGRYFIAARSQLRGNHAASIFVVTLLKLLEDAANGSLYRKPLANRPFLQSKRVAGDNSQRSERDELPDEFNDVRKLASSLGETRLQHHQGG